MATGQASGLGHLKPLFRAFLLLYPRAFRDEYGREITLAYTDRIRHTSSRSERALVSGEAIAGILTEAPKEHLHMLLQDLRYTLRTLRQSPGFALAAVFTLALGIGANTAVFSVVDAVLLRPLPYPEADRLVMIWEKRRDRSDAQNVVSPADFLDWRARSKTLERSAMFRAQRATLTGRGEPLEVQTQSVNRDFFSVLRATPHRGRLLSAEDDRPGAPPVVVISHRLWQQRFGGDEEIIGRAVRANSSTVTVVGILPPEFQFMGSDVDLWSPLGLNEAGDWRQQAGRFVNVVARLKVGASRDDAQRELSSIAQQLEHEHAAFNSGWGVNVVALRDQIAGEMRTPLWVLLAAVGLLLCIACANVANLLLARAAVRRREIAVRLAIGASRARLVRQFLTESLFLSLTGAAVGLLVAWISVRVFALLSPRQLGTSNLIVLDARVLSYSVLLAMLTGVLFGLAPIFTSLRTSVQRALKEGGRGATRQTHHLRSLFIVAQCTLTVVLLIGAGLLLRSFLKLRAQDAGLSASHLLTMRVSLPIAAYREPERRVQFFEETAARLEQLPGVRSASATAYLPFTGDAAGTYVRIAGQQPAPPDKELITIVRMILPDYFRTMGIPLLQGRSFTREDNRAATPLHFVVNREFVRRFLGGRDPLRERLSVLMRDENPFAEIVGVVGDVREGALDKPPEPTVYYPYAHLPSPSMTVVIRTLGDPLTMATAATRVIRSLDGNQPVAEVRSMEQVLGSTLTRQRFAATLLTVFSVLALLLAAVGVYSLLSYLVVERSQEVGVRIALGAQTKDVLQLVVSQGLGWALTGLATGLGGALLLGPFLRSMLFGIGTADLTTLSGVTGLLLLVSLFATVVPAWRASRLDPIKVLRQE